MDGERQGRSGPALYLASEARAEAEVVLVSFGVEPKEEGGSWFIAGQWQEFSL